MSVKHLYILLLVLSAGRAGAHTPPRDSSMRFFGVPLLFYTPDTRWGIGAAGIFTFPTYPIRSSLTFNFSYTQRKQLIISFPFQWFENGNRWRAYGEMGWYRYLYRYFGIGNTVPNSYEEYYTARFPRIRLTVARNLNTRNFLGLRFFFEDYEISGASEGGEIALGEVEGTQGGLCSSAGPVWVRDSRDNPYFPRRGWLSETVVTFENRLTGSDYTFVRCSIDVARYYPLGRSTLALNGIGIFTNGHIPFFLMPQLGGTRRLRGYPEGKYRDKHLVMFQTEWRFPLFWRFKGVGFAGAGTVFGTPHERARIHPNLGAGLRIEFDRKAKLHLRVDYGVGEGAGNSGFYITVGEAF